MSLIPGRLLVALTCIFLTVVQSSASRAEVDPHSFARPWEVRVTHVDLDLSVDFSRKVLKGSATLHLNNSTNSKTLRLDSRDLKIFRVFDVESGQALKFDFGQSSPQFGQEIVIELAPFTKKIRIDYETDPSAKAIQWLVPEQTLGKKRPYLFTQSQPIHARSWIPLQDTPEVRVTYSADITVPKDLMALMSAENPRKKSKDGKYHFEMPQPIPSYLIALAVGDLRFKRIGAKTGVYAESGILEAAHYELANMEKILAAGERITGHKYFWGRYDTLVLPPSFPYGGMEHPRITFATPSAIVGDRSLEGLHAHELAHSWTGNSVTNKNGAHFWLNEGFTVYLERRILEQLYGQEESEVQARVGYQMLMDAFDEFSKTSLEFTKLRPNLAGVDPDEVYSDVPYEKGYLFVRHIEETVGRKRFSTFLHRYIEHFKFQSIGTDDFLEFLEVELIKGDEALRSEINASGWIDGEKLPAKAPQIRAVALDRIDQVKLHWLDHGVLDLERIKAFSPYEWVYFISLLKAANAEQLAELDKTFELTKSRNPEVLVPWMVLGISKGYSPTVERSEEFLRSTGRGKFIKPIYQALVQNGHVDEATRIFRSAFPAYHNIARSGVSGVHASLKEVCDHLLALKNIEEK